MGEGERCGSVTDLLQGSVDLYVPPSPRHHPPPDPDCWGEPSRASKHDKDKAADTALNNSTPVGDAQKNTNGHGKGQLEDRLNAREQIQDSSKASNAKSTAQNKAEAEMRTPKEKTKPGIKQRKVKPGSGPDQGKPRGAATEKVRPGAKSEKTTIQGSRTAGRGKQGSDDDNSLLPPPKPRPATMTGCSGAYQQAVRAVRGASPEGSVVMLGPAGEQPTAPTPSQAPSSHINKFSFAVAMAATKMKSLGLRRSPLSGRGGGSATIRDDAETNSASLTPSSMQSVKRSHRQRPGRKVFEDAYVITWSQPVLHADQAEFRITFDKPKKARVLRVRQTRRRSSGPEVMVPPPEPEERDTLAAEWMEWRKTHDRVEQWLRDNAQTEADESHVVAMLLDPDPRKGALYRT